MAPPADAAGGGQPGPTKEVSRPSAPAVADTPGAPDYRWASGSATPLSSLIVLPALTDDVDSFRKLVASLKLGLAALQLDAQLVAVDDIDGEREGVNTTDTSRKQVLSLRNVDRALRHCANAAGHSGCLIFEDDAVFHPKFREELPRTLQQLDGLERSLYDVVTVGIDLFDSARMQQLASD